MSVHYLRCETSGRALRIAQLTDTHLKAYSGGKLLGLDTDYSLEAVVQLVRREFPSPDLLLGTGDLADSGAPGAYERLQGYFNAITPRHYWLPGNHDQRETMVEVAGAARLPFEIRGGGWQILLLDSQLPGEVGGHLGDVELARLEAALEEGSEQGLHTLLCLHHQPVPVGCEWLDQQMVSDAPRFFAIVDRFPAVRGVLWGHVHQELERRRGDVLLMCSPSTCVQFLPGQRDFAVDLQPPGYRWLELSQDGEIRTGTSRCESQIFPVDREASGYA